MGDVAGHTSIGRASLMFDQLPYATGHEMFIPGPAEGTPFTEPAQFQPGSSEPEGVFPFAADEPDASGRNSVEIRRFAAGPSDADARISIEIRKLPSLPLEAPIRATARYEDGEWIAEAVDLPLYGSGESFDEARQMLEREIESLWDDLQEGGDFADEWHHVATFLRRVISA